MHNSSSHKRRKHILAVFVNFIFKNPLCSPIYPLSEFITRWKIPDNIYNCVEQLVLNIEEHYYSRYGRQRIFRQSHFEKQRNCQRPPIVGMNNLSALL